MIVRIPRFNTVHHLSHLEVQIHPIPSIYTLHSFSPAHYQDLKEYKARNGDCNVPMRKDDPKLGEWVGQQRKAYRLKMDGKQSAMTDERMEKLNKIGFTWRLRKRKIHPECEDEGGNGANAGAHAGDDVGKSEEETATAVVEQVAKHLAASSANAEDDAQVHVEV